MMINISGLEKLSLVDYDGFTAATVFTSGCNFACPFCHNSSILRTGLAPLLNESEVLDYLKKRKGLLDAVCISGGEPTLQKNLPSFIETLKNMGYKIKLDSNGSAPNVLKTLIESGLIDYVAMDIKNSKENYPVTVGKNLDMTSIEKSVELLLSGKVDYEFRTTLVRELHDDADMRDIGEWLKGAKRYYMQKFKDSEDCLKRGFHPIDEEKALEYKRLLESLISIVELRGY